MIGELGFDATGHRQRLYRGVHIVRELHLFRTAVRDQPGSEWRWYVKSGFTEFSAEGYQRLREATQAIDSVLGPERPAFASQRHVVSLCAHCVDNEHELCWSRITSWSQCECLECTTPPSILLYAAWALEDI